MEEKNRIKYIDLCKGLGILMVTLGHVTTLANPLDQWMSSMKLSIFFVAAGYLICYLLYLFFGRKRLSEAYSTLKGMIR